MEHTYENTIAAIAAYDRLNEDFSAALDARPMPEQPIVLAWFDRLEAVEKAVGAAFAVDTADVNRPDECTNIRPTAQLRANIARATKTV